MISRAAMPAIQAGRIPAPVGMNTVQAGPTLSDADAVYLYNLVQGELGLRARTGYRETATGLTGAADDCVRTMLPFTGSVASKNRLFAVNDSGIYDVSAGGAIGAASLSFASSANNAGRGVSTVVVTAAGHFLVYTDEENGLFVYTESTDTWAQVTHGAGAGQIDGVDPASFCFCAVWKGRLWFVQKDSTKAWYTDAGALFGDLTGQSLDFAQRFKAGGYLVGLWSWTYDGGAGLDDSLVAISSGGDVAIYQGTDPASSTTFGLQGVWNVGAVPVGRRIATESGGDLLILSTLGAIPASKLVVSGQTASPQYATAKIANLFAQLAQTYRSTQGWGLYVHPADAALMVTVPEYGAQSATTQLVMHFASGGWSRYRDLPVVSGCVWDGDFYFGTADGKVCQAVGYVDAVPLDASTSTPVKYSMLSRFHNLGNANFKIADSVRPILLSGQSNPAWQATARFDYNILEPSEPSSSSSGGPSDWGTGLWDSAVWGADYTPETRIQGLSGMGRDVAIALRGAAISRTVLAGFDVWFQEGGTR